MNEFLLFLFPVCIIVILAVGAKIRKAPGSFLEAWSLDQAKALQVFAALMIILHHMVQRITNCGGVKKGPVTAWNSFGILFTSVFFFFSGFGLMKSLKTKDHYLDGFLRKRLPTILIPFLIVNLIFLIFVREGRVNSALDVFTSIPGFTLLNSNAWFVVEIFFLYIAFYICFRKASSEKAAILWLSGFTVALVIFSLLLGHDGSRIGGHWFMGEWWFNTTLIFIMGILFGKNEERLKEWMNRRWKILFPVTIVVLIGWYFFEQFIEGRFGYYREWEGHPGYGEKLITLPVQVILCALFIFFLLLLNLKVEFGNPVLRFIGSFCFELYLIHDVYRRSLPGGVGGKMPDLLYLGLTYVLAILSAWLLSKVDQYLLKLWRRKFVKTKIKE